MFIDGPIEGMTYVSGTRSGTVGDESWPSVSGERVTFSIGELELGSSVAGDKLSVRDLAGADASTPLRDSRTTNLARFLYSFGTEPDLRSGVRLTPEAVAVVNAHASGIDFDADEETFANNPEVTRVFDELGLRLRSAEEARNHLRRSLIGIRLHRDVEIPTRDGSFLSADVFLPTESGKHPVIMRQSIYGKAFGRGSAVTVEQQQAADIREEFWHENDGVHWLDWPGGAENAASGNVTTWVPRGYVMIRVDARGIGKSPGAVAPYSVQEAEDYYDAIEWAAAQPWSDGQVGLLGNSYAAITQFPVAALQPPALKAMIPYACDVDGYRETIYQGGIYSRPYREWWWENMVGSARPNGEGPMLDFLGDLAAHPFDDEFWHSATEAPITFDWDALNVPVLTSVSQTGLIHSRAGFEVFRRLRDQVPVYLQIVDSNYFPFMLNDTVEDQIAFMDKYMKGADVELPPVRYIIRTGNGEFEWAESEVWPLEGTTYTELYLDAADGSAGWEPPAENAAVTYTADPAGDPLPRPGAYFFTQPLTEDLELAGPFAARLWVSSSSSDADVYVALRVFDGDTEVLYPTLEVDPKAPFTRGVLRASHRALDETKSEVGRPFHTHTKEDYAPLTPGEPVEMVVEVSAATARIKAGHRIRVEVTAMEGPGSYIGLPAFYDPAYHEGATNTVHTGPDRRSAIVLPVIA
jgi:predicted acyl esterase